MLGFPRGVEAIDIIVTVDYANAVIVQLSAAVVAPRRDKPR